MLGLKLIHVSKRGHWSQAKSHVSLPYTHSAVLLWKLLACARTSTTNKYVTRAEKLEFINLPSLTRARCESQLAVKTSGLNAHSSFCLILNSSVGLWVGIQSAGHLVSQTSCIQQRKTACLLSIRKSLACARASKLTITNIYASENQAILG